jgi:hypothetical protein
MFKNLNTNTLNFLFKKTSKSLKFVTTNLVATVVLTASVITLGFANIEVKAATVNFVATITLLVQVHLTLTIQLVMTQAEPII